MSNKLPYVDMTHDELGEELNISRSTVSNIEYNAIAKFKRELARRGIYISDLIDVKEPESDYLKNVRLADKANEN